jgi:predicted MPP superfamily phosphohydrolase
MVKIISRRKFFDYLLRIGICAGFGYPIGIEPNWLDLVCVEVPIHGLPAGLDGMKVGFIADIHRSPFVAKSDISRATRVLQGLKPDLILIGGDFVKGKAKYIHSCSKILSKLKAQLGVYAVLGNHDYWTNPDIIVSSLEDNHIRVLINESVQLEWNDSRFYLIGLDDAWEGRPQLRKALNNTARKDMKILLVHEPDYADRIKSVDNWIPLQLSGHSHGGQVSIPFAGPIYYPYLAEKYPSGLRRVRESDRWVYTTKGIGVTIPVRFNCRPEVSLLTLVQSS